MVESRSKCQVPGCIRKVHAGWESENGTSLRVCMVHMKKHISRMNNFNFHDVVGEKNPHKYVMDELELKLCLERKEKEKMKRKSKKERIQNAQKVRKVMLAEKRKAKKKTSKKKVPKRPVGQLTGLGVFAAWVKMFTENEKRKTPLNDEQILIMMKQDFPGYAAKSKVFSMVNVQRKSFNKGVLTKGIKPPIISYEHG